VNGEPAWLGDGGGKVRGRAVSWLPGLDGFTNPVIYGTMQFIRDGV